MRILGIDPGLTVMGFSVAVSEGGRMVLLDFGSLSLSSKQPIPERLFKIHLFLNQKIAEWHITDIALETPFLGRNVHSFMKLGYVRGIIYLVAHAHSLHLHEFAPAEIKRSITGSGAADKLAVARTLARLFPGLTQGDKLDVTDAIAVSLCGLWRQRFFSVR